jgi:thioredoxin 1
MKIIDYSEETFGILIKENKVVVLKFSAEWCGPCRALHSQMTKDTSDMLVVECDVTDNPEIAQFHKVASIPHLVFYVNGVVTGKPITGANLEKIKSTYKEYSEAQ